MPSKNKHTFFAKAYGEAVRIRTNLKMREFMNMGDNEPIVPQELLHESLGFYQFERPDIICFPYFGENFKSSHHVNFATWKKRGVDLGLLVTKENLAVKHAETFDSVVTITKQQAFELDHSVQSHPYVWFTADINGKLVSLKQFLQRGGF